MKKIAIFCLMLVSVAFAKADDFGLWSEVGVTQNLGVKGLSADLGIGFRANNHLKNVDRWSGSLGLNYTICPYLKVGASYSYIYSYNLPDQTTKPHYTTKSAYASFGGVDGYNVTQSFTSYWRSKHRWALDLKTGFDLGRFSFSLRERYQYTRYNTVDYIKAKEKTKYRFTPIFDAEGALVDKVWKTPETEERVYEPDTAHFKHKDYLRSKLEASYNIRHCPITPFASIELENNLGDAFHLDEVRYSAGAEWKISKKLQLGMAYHFNCGEDDDEDGNIHAIEVTLKIKNPFWKAKAKK